MLFAAPEGSPKLTSVVLYQITASRLGVRPVRRTEAADRLFVRPAPSCREARLRLDDSGSINVVLKAPLNTQFFCEARLGEWRDKRVGTLKRNQEEVTIRVQIPAEQYSLLSAEVAAELNIFANGDGGQTYTHVLSYDLIK